MPNASTLVYIAYARADRARVEPIVAALRERGVNVDFDEGSAHGASNYVHNSQQALRRASVLVVFVSAASARSAWVEAETRAFQSRMAQDPQREIIPVRLDATPLPLALAHYTALDGSSPVPAVVADALGNAIRAVSPGKGSSGPHDGAPAPDEADEVAPAPVEEATRSALPPSPPPLAPEPITPAPAPAPEPEPAPSFPPPTTPGPDTGGRSPFPVRPPAPQPDRSGYAQKEPGAAWNAAPAPAPQQTRLEQVTFTAYHPREMQAQQWQPLVVYLSLDDPATMAQVASAAAERLAGKLDQFRPGRSEKSVGMARGTALRIVPAASGIVFNPSHLDVTWQEDVQQHEFRMRAETAKPGQAVNGVVQFYQGMLLRAEVPFSVFVGQAAARLDSPDAYAKAIARAYRRIFASYSHQDMPVVESCETAARTMGDQYLRDVSLLQSGQQWDPRLIQAINDADIFQLFWSRRAATSPFVEREWRHALMLLPTRPNFIRPVYWSRQLYPTPPELNALHFQPLSLATLGWGQLRIAWYNWRNR